MMKARVSCVSALAVLLALTGCGSSAVPEPEGFSAQRVVGGGVDTTNQFPWVGFLGTPSWSCSAELITPNWILTANHCITGTTDTPTTGDVMGQFDVSFDPVANSGTGGNPSFHFSHSPFTAGDADSKVFVRKSGAIDSGSREDNAQDLALIRLDKSVPASLFAPAPIAGFTAPAGALGCTSIAQNGGVATLIGYGPTDGSFCATGDVFCSSGPFPGRNSFHDGGWGYQNANAGDQYLSNTWSVLSYHGTAHGDSGGALFWAAQGQVCGINSGFYDNGGYATDYEAQVDSPLNNAFLRQHLLNADGTLKGTCNLTTQGFLGEASEAGGTVFQITGNGFDTAHPPAVTFDGVPALGVTCSSTTQCSVTAPPHANGLVHLSVSMWTNSVCTANTLAVQYGPVQPSCSASYACQANYVGAATISCPFGVTGTLWRSTNGGASVPIQTATQNVTGFADYYSPGAGAQIVYQVVASDADGTSGSAPMTVTAKDCSCHPATTCESGYNCGTMSDGCGGHISCGTCAGGVLCGGNVCGGRVLHCPIGTGDCGGYCCRNPN